MNISEAVEKILNNLEDQKKRIVARRFGLLGYNKVTLAKIGSDINRTRERVRQIESASLEKLEEEKNQEQIKKTIEKIQTGIKKLGGVVTIPEISDLIFGKKEADKEKRNGLAFLVTIIPKMKRARKNQHYKPFWYKKDFKEKTIKNITDEYENILKDIGGPIEADKLISKFKKTGLGKKVKYNKKALRQITNIKRSISQDKKGKVGLMSWPQINPKSARDKAYLVLKEEKQPLHFKEIAKKIKKDDFYSNHTPTAPTVHNEVILDDRFVLVGRGKYALKEWGYKPGTVKDIIENVLKENPKGLSKDKIIKKVSKQRKVARNTILANLNRKEDFKKVKDNQYQLAKN